MRELGLAGSIAIAFTLLSYYATRGPSGGELGWYGWANLVGGSVAALVAHDVIEGQTPEDLR